MQKELQELAAQLESLSGAPVLATVGFDGFVDEIVEVVDQRQAFNAYRPMLTIKQFAQRISAAAGLSTNVELVPKTVKLGGNGPIMANALALAGVEVAYLGTLGVPNIHPVFLEFTERCGRVFSVGAPGHTDALEFNDGKVMLGKMEALNELTWPALLALVGEAELKRLFTAADLIATVNWTMLPHMNGIWEGLLGLISPCQEGAKPYFFVDLADPGKRNPRHILQALDLITRFNSCYQVVLGLNRKEATEIATVMKLKLTAPPDQVSLEEITIALGQALGLCCLLVHPVHEAAAFSRGGYVSVKGPYTSKPRLTTGAGDNFNAGFCLGLMLQLGLKKSLILGTAVSGFYVRNATSPSWHELVGFLELWAGAVGKDF